MDEENKIKISNWLADKTKRNLPLKYPAKNLEELGIKISKNETSAKKAYNIKIILQKYEEKGYIILTGYPL